MKTGLDDFLVARGNDALVELLRRCRRPVPILTNQRGQKRDLPVPMIAEWALAHRQFRFAASGLWVFHRGAYRRYGREVATKLAFECLNLDESWTRKRMASTVTYIETKTLVPERLGLPEGQIGHVNVLNGRVNVATGELEPHSWSGFDVVQLPVRYDPHARCPCIDAFLQDVLEDQDKTDLVEEMVGYCLVPVAKLERAFMLIGAGANGKSTLLSLMEALLGSDNVSKVALQDLADNRFRLAELHGKLANVCADLDSRSLSTSSVFKAIVSGDPLAAERKFKDPFDFRPYAKLIFSANALPFSPDHTPAYFRRWSIIPFNKSFPPGKADVALIDKLATAEELSGFFNRALSALRRLLTSRRFTEPAAVQVALDEYRLDLNPVLRFVQERCTMAAGARVPKETLFEAYKDWCAQEGIEHPMQAARLAKELRQIVPGLSEVRPKTAGEVQPRVWVGVGLKGGSAR